MAECLFHLQGEILPKFFQNLVQNCEITPKEFKFFQFYPRATSSIPLAIQIPSTFEINICDLKTSFLIEFENDYYVIAICAFLLENISCTVGKIMPTFYIFDEISSLYSILHS